MYLKTTDLYFENQEKLLSTVCKQSSQLLKLEVVLFLIWQPVTWIRANIWNVVYIKQQQCSGQ